MHIVLLGGSLRPQSLNLRLLRHLAREMEARGHRVTPFTGDALRLPLYEDDLTLPGNLRPIAEALRSAEAFVVVSPEYNAGIPGHLKNLVDWLSVQSPNPFAGLPVLVASASPGAFGGSRGVLAWRATLANLGCWVAPAPITVPRADQALGEDGHPLEARTGQEIGRALDTFLAGAARLRG